MERKGVKCDTGENLKTVDGTTVRVGAIVRMKVVAIRGETIMVCALAFLLRIVHWWGCCDGTAGEIVKRFSFLKVITFTRRWIPL